MNDCKHETICMCAGRPECHECSWPFYGCETIEEAEARRDEWAKQAVSDLVSDDPDTTDELSNPQITTKETTQ